MKTFTQYLEMAQEDYSFLDEFLQITNWTPEDGSRYADVLSEHDLLYHIDDQADDIIGFEELPEEIVNKLEEISQTIHDFPDALEAYFAKGVDANNMAYKRGEERDNLDDAGSDNAI